MRTATLNRLARAAAFGVVALAATSALGESTVSKSSQQSVPVTRHKTVDVDGLDIFYREAGPSGAPVVLLLHGFPSSSHMFRHLMPELAGCCD